MTDFALKMRYRKMGEAHQFTPECTCGWVGKTDDSIMMANLEHHQHLQDAHGIFVLDGEWAFVMDQSQTIDTHDGYCIPGKLNRYE